MLHTALGLSEKTQCSHCHITKARAIRTKQEYQC